MSDTFLIVKKYIDRMDYCALLAGGAPADEFDIESKEISENICYVQSAVEIAYIIAAVFHKYFDKEVNIKSLLPVAVQIKSELENQIAKRDIPMVNAYKNVDPDEFHDKCLTLHDCIADKIKYENHALHFYFPDGFWITTKHKSNASGKVLRTDASVVAFSLEDIADIYLRVFTRKRRFLFTKTSVEIWDIERLIDSVNSGKCTIEFVTQYRSYFEQLWHCEIRSHKKPYFRECQLIIPNTNATYFWNNLCLDREW